MDENATKALYIAVTIFIVMLTLGFVVAYFNTARKAGNLAILGSAVAENYEKLLNSDLDKTEMTGVEVINMLRKYGGKYLFALGKENNKWNLSKTYVMPDRQLVKDLGRESELDTDINALESNNAIIGLDKYKNIPTKFLETINPNIVYTVDKIEKATAQSGTIFCGVDLRFNIYPKDPADKDKAFISPETEVYVSKGDNAQEVEYTNTMKKYFKANLSLTENGKIFNLSGKWTLKLLCDATEANISFDPTTSGDTIHDGIEIVDESNKKVTFESVQFDATGESGKMIIVLHGLKSNSGSNDIYIRRITLNKDSIRSRDGQYSEEMKLEFSPMLYLDAPI